LINGNVINIVMKKEFYFFDSIRYKVEETWCYIIGELYNLFDSDYESLYDSTKL